MIFFRKSCNIIIKVTRYLNAWLELTYNINSSNDSPKENGSNDETPPRFRDAIKRLLTNKLFMYNFGSSLFFVLAFVGFGTFMPKYFEHQFKMRRSSR